MRFRLNKLEIRDIIFFFLLLFQYLMCSISGFKVSGHMASCLIIVVWLIAGLCLKKIQMRKIELDILIIIILPFVLLGIVQCLYYANPEIIIRCAGVFFNVITAYAISKYIGFVKFAMMLRFLTLINIVLIVSTVCFGDVIIDLSSKGMFSSGLFISWSILKFPVFLGSWDIGVETFRCGGLFGHPNGFGLMAAVGIIGMAYENDRLEKKIFWWSVFLLSFFISESRAGFLFVMTFYLFRNLCSRKITPKSLLANVLFLFLFMILSIFLLTLRSNNQLSDVDVTSGRSELMDIVYSAYASGLDINKLLGIGIGNATEYLKVMIGMNIPLDNSYIPLLLEMGIVGGSVWILVLVGFFFYSMYMSERKYSVPFFIGMLVYSIFEHEFSMDIYSLHWLVYFLSCISNKNEIL